ncbi:ChaN family lipoprotein [Cyclobacterium amurskyense]|uniref:Putative iron-regulated protein n=1 Tax=Cyclobacterium amurskyense TaxID=320787 RepID=A0A0H4PHU0_9BACT|nr:ChaN family lipoprotein [Cyclobacterium amurskyense]AKP54086.1 Putative iron-regulated protein [Cyclobacterium amurskyense]
MLLFIPSLFLFLLQQAALPPKDLHKQNYTIYETATGNLLSLDSLVERLNSADIIVFGEEHNDSLGHVLQYQLYKRLLESHESVTLSMEMFERDVQRAVNEYLAGLITESKLLHAGKAWNNYSAYAPMVNLAKDRNQQVVAANVPGRYANMVSRKGLGSLNQLDRKARHLYAKVKIPEKDDAYLAKFNAAMGEHAHSMGPTVFHAQLLRDATMAESILKAHRKNRNTKILHLTGRFHSDERLGTVSELKKRKRKLNLVTISCFANPKEDDQDWSTNEALADFIILTN